MNILPIVAARMGSTRLPGKTLAPLGGRRVLNHVIDRVRQSGIGEPVVATTWLEQDDPIDQACSLMCVPCYRGHPTDLITRFYECATHYGADLIVRVTADCPLLNPDLLAQVARRLEKSGADYVGVRGAPTGTHQEAFTMRTLALTHRLATRPEDREHIVTFILNRPAMFRQDWITVDIPGPAVTLDTPADLERLQKLVA